MPKKNKVYHYESRHVREHICPRCGKRFFPAPYHQWRIGYTDAFKLVCSYTCMRKWEKEKVDKRKTKKKGLKLSDKENHDG